MPERTFTEEEIQALLKRATQLHIQDEPDQSGLTLADLEHIAADAGVPPKYLRAALHERDNQIEPRDVSGHTKTHVYIDRVEPGELTDDEWEQVVLRLRKEYSNDMGDLYGMGAQYGRGVTETLGKTREWRHTSGMGVVTTLTIRSAGGKQFINLQRRVGLGSPRSEGFGYGLIVAAVAAAIVGGITTSGLIALITLLGALAIAAPGIEYLDRRWRQGVLDDMHAVTDDIAALVRNKEAEAEPEPMVSAVAAPVASEKSARVELEDLDVYSEHTPAERARTRG